MLALVVHLAFWVTLVFAILERSPRTQALTPWTPEQLPEVPDAGRSSRLSDLIASLVFLTLFAVVIVWQQAEPFTFGPFESIPVLDPELWSFWLPYFLVLIVLEMLFAIAVYVGLELVAGRDEPAAQRRVRRPRPVAVRDRAALQPEFLDVIGWPWGEVGRDDDRVRGGVRRRRVWDVIDGVIKTVRGAAGRRSAHLSGSAGFAARHPPSPGRGLLRLHADRRRRGGSPRR